QVPSASRNDSSSASDCRQASLIAAPYPRFFSNTIKLIRGTNAEASLTVSSVEPSLTTVIFTSVTGEFWMIWVLPCRHLSMVCAMLSSSLRAGIAIRSFMRACLTFYNRSGVRLMPPMGGCNNLVECRMLRDPAQNATGAPGIRHQYRRISHPPFDHPGRYGLPGSCLDRLN